MKKIIIPITLLLFALTACNDDAKNLEREYGRLLEKEYAELESSERYKTFKDRYQLLTALSEEVNTKDEIDIAEVGHVDTLCFIPPNEFDLQVDQDIEEKKAEKKEVKPFSKYINQSNEVNATIVAEGFYKKDVTLDEFEDEDDLHNISNILNKAEYLGNMGADTATIYHLFCEDRVRMDRVNNSRYFLFLKELVNISSEYDETKGKDEFSSGAYVGIVYVYDIAAKKFIHSFTITETNSDTVEGEEKTIGNTIQANLYKNIQTGIKQAIKENFGLRGELPHLN